MINKWLLQENCAIRKVNRILNRYNYGDIQLRITPFSSGWDKAPAKIYGLADVCSLQLYANVHAAYKCAWLTLSRAGVCIVSAQLCEITARGLQSWFRPSGHSLVWDPAVFPWPTCPLWRLPTGHQRSAAWSPSCWPRCSGTAPSPRQINPVWREKEWDGDLSCSSGCHSLSLLLCWLTTATSYNIPSEFKRRVQGQYELGFISHKTTLAVRFL